MQQLTLPRRAWPRTGPILPKGIQLIHIHKTAPWSAPNSMEELHGGAALIHGQDGWDYTFKIHDGRVPFTEIPL